MDLDFSNGGGPVGSPTARQTASPSVSHEHDHPGRTNARAVSIGAGSTKTQRPPRDIIREMVSPKGRLEPFGLYRELRFFGNVVPVRPGLIAVLGYDEVNEVLRRPEFKVLDKNVFGQQMPQWEGHASVRGYLNSVLHLNAPRHRQVRRVMSPPFAPQATRGYEPMVADLADELLDNLEDKRGTVDFVAEFASRLPIVVVSTLMGVSVSEQEWLAKVAARLTLALEGITKADLLADADRAMEDLAGYLMDEVVPSAREGSVVDRLAALHGDSKDLSFEELVGNVMLTVTAGFETTSFLLGSYLNHCLRSDRVRQLTLDGHAETVVEEVLRHDSPVQATSRWAREATHVADVEVPAGTKLLLMLGAANRDPKRFANPDVFDPTREESSPLSFGAGPHFCLGAPLSRMEARVAMPRLLARFPDLRLAGEPVRRDQWVGRGFNSYPIVMR